MVVKWRNLGVNQLDKKTLWTLMGGAWDTFFLVERFNIKDKVNKLSWSIRKNKNNGALGYHLVGATA